MEIKYSPPARRSDSDVVHCVVPSSSTKDCLKICDRKKLDAK